MAFRSAQSPWQSGQRPQPRGFPKLSGVQQPGGRGTGTPGGGGGGRYLPVLQGGGQFGQQPMGGGQQGGYPLNDARNPLTAGGRGAVQAAGGWEELMQQQGHPIGGGQGIPGVPPGPGGQQGGGLGGMVQDEGNWTGMAGPMPFPPRPAGPGHWDMSPTRVDGPPRWVPDTSGGGQQSGQPGVPGVGGQQGGWLGGVAGAMGQPGPAITSQIQPQGIYSDRSTQAGINQALALGQQTAFGTPSVTMGGFAGSSPTLQNRNMMNAAGALGDSSAAAEQIRLGDRAANQQNMLAGQAARGIDALGQFQNLGSFNQANQQYGTRMGGQLIDATQNRFGGIQNALQQDTQDRAWWQNYGLQQQQANMMQQQNWGNMLAGLTGSGGLGGALNWL